MLGRICILILLNTLLLTGCWDNDIKSDEQNSINIMMGNEKPTLIDDHTIRLKAHYYASSTFSLGKLAPKNLFTFTMDDQSATEADFSIKEISTQHIQKDPEPISLFLLVDKRANLLLGTTPYKVIEKQLTNFYRARADYEINIGAFASQNTRFNSFTVASPRFGAIEDISISNRAFMFDITKNGGSNNLAAGLDSALTFIARNASFNKRAILILTDRESTISDPRTTNQLIAKAKQLNTSLSVFNTTFPEPVYSTTNLVHHHLVSSTGGVHFSQLTSTTGTSSYDLLFPAYHDFLSGINYYESIIEIKNKYNVFAVNPAFTIWHSIKCFDQKGILVQFYYEK